MYADNMETECGEIASRIPCTYAARLFHAHHNAALSSRNNFARAAYGALATAYILYIPETSKPITA